MEKGQILDIAHISFLDMIRSTIAQTGPAATKGTLMRNTLTTADRFEPTDFPTLDDFVASIEDVSNPITSVEGKAVHFGNGLFGLPACPFATSISNYKSIFSALPEGYNELTEEYNKPNAMTEKYKVGSGAGVSPFCAVHQPLRSALADKITIGGKSVKIYQLGCKSGSGKSGLAENWISEVGLSPEEVTKVLETNMCCYQIKLVDSV